MAAPALAAEQLGTTPARSLRLSPVTPLPERLAVGKGTAIFVDGLCAHPGCRISGLRVSVDGVDHPVMASGMPPPGAFEGSDYWWAVVPFEAIERPRLARLRLRARAGREGEAVGDLGVVELHPRLDAPEPARFPPGTGPSAPGGPPIAICMATYEPPIDLFERQVESLRAQTHGNWVCVISDDASSPERLELMRSIIVGDDRFQLAPSPRRLGFYENFERALAIAPPDAAYVALCDQDDRWLPEKLEVLARRIGGAKLVYSDMRIVGRDGRVISPTYWSYRRNNHKNFGSLLIANTVTGAASLVAREVLDYALPFPRRYEAAYHDHWLALVAMALGRIDYVDRPLYDYVQHRGAAIGHERANGRADRTIPGPPLEGDPIAALRERVERVTSLRMPRGMRHLYFTHYCGTVITAKVVDARCREVMEPAKRRAVRRFSEPERVAAWLAARAPRRWLGRTETLRREQAMLGGLAWRVYAEGRKRMSELSERRERGARPGTGGAAGPLAGSPAAADPAAALARRAAPALAGAGGNGAGAPRGPWLTPILVDYFTRDGSTLMMRLLATSPHVAVDEQYPYERKYFGYLWRWSRMLDRGQWPSEEWSPSALASITQESHQTMLGPPPWHPRPLIEASGVEPFSRTMFDCAWRELSRRAAQATAGPDADPDGVRFYAEKHLDTWLLDTAELPPFEPIVLLRDPRDTYVSIRAFNRMRASAGFGRHRAGSEREHLDQLIARQRERLRWVADLLGRDDPPVVRYEDLVLDLDGVAHRLEGRFGIALDARAASEDRELRKAHVSARSPEASIGRWRHELDTEAADVFRRELGDELRALGFEP
jgi:hypothetical protein